MVREFDIAGNSIPLRDETEPAFISARSETSRELNLCEQAARRIHTFLVTRQVFDGALIGPDPGVRFNYRFWRFIKSVFPRANWRDERYYLQAQGYWILANWMLSQADGDLYEKVALAATEQVLTRQRGDGAWDQPNPEWKGRITTVEGIWASLGLLESYRHCGRTAYLDAALKWHEFLESKIGYQKFAGNIAVNYFADRTEEPVPNNSALALRYLANMADITGDASFLDKCDGLLRFIQEAQLVSGEVPYIYGNPQRVHFQCFQYQAFLYLDVLEYYRLTGNWQARSVLIRILGFLERGISPEGFVYYQCGQRHRVVNYHAGAVAAAFASAHEIGVSGQDEFADKAYRCLLRQQCDDGSVPHSRGDYGFLSDRRAYPRYLTMMMFHLLTREISTREACGATAHE